MTTVRSAKSKGAQMEYSVRDSLLPIIPDILLTKEEGFIKQFDLISHTNKLAIEAKKHKGFSWNELVKLFKKLKSKAPDGYTSILIFQGNRQPCLIMKKGDTVMPFKKHFKTPFIVHNKR